MGTDGDVSDRVRYRSGRSGLDDSPSVDDQESKHGEIVVGDYKIPMRFQPRSGVT